MIFEFLRELVAMRFLHDKNQGCIQSVRLKAEQLHRYLAQQSLFQQLASKKISVQPLDFEDGFGCR
jgi:hypothetical protein